MGSHTLIETRVSSGDESEQQSQEKQEFEFCHLASSIWRVSNEKGARQVNLAQNDITVTFRLRKNIFEQWIQATP